jgi:DHA1 family multidrug resistance protein-like MFS transporter
MARENTADDQDAPLTREAPQDVRLGGSFYIILASLFMTSIGFGFTNPFLPLFIQDIGRFNAREAALWAGLVQACAGGIQIFAGPIWGIFGDWFGHKRNILRAAIGASSVMIATALVQNIAWLAVTRFFMGLTSGVMPATLGLLGSVTPKHRLPFAVGMAQGMSSLGFTLGPLIGASAVYFLGYRWGFVAAGAMIGISGLFIINAVRLPPGGPSRGMLTPRQIWKDFKEILKVRGMYSALIMVGAAQLAPNFVQPATAFYVLSLDPAATTATVGLYFFVSGIAVAAAAWAMSLLSRRFPLRALIVLGCGVLAAGAFMVSLAQSVPAALAWGAVTGWGSGMLTAGASAWMGTIAPRERAGAAYGLVQSANSIGFGIGPLLGGIVANGVGLRAPFTGEAILAIAIAAFVLTRRQA